MKFIKKLRNLILVACIAISPAFSYATNISNEFLAFGNKVQMIVELNRLTIFLLSCAIFMIIAAIWKLTRQLVGAELIPRLLTLVIITSSFVAWMLYFLSGINA